MKLFIAIPALNEADYLPQTLQAIREQKTIFPYEIFVCINQPEAWWSIDEKAEICRNNQRTLSELQAIRDLPLHIIDRSSPRMGWTGKNFGVGWARKCLFDTILEKAESTDILISLDADTRIPPDYLQSIGDNFRSNHRTAALSLPYYHPATGQEEINRAMLHYEIYMRNYYLLLSKIDSPYSFTAIGSAMAIKCGLLKQIGGITPIKSGEDFYLIQKLCKIAQVGIDNACCVYPAARLSNRVFFGTGPALIKGIQDDWESYPIYHHQLFEEIKTFYDNIPRLFIEDIPTAFGEFLQTQFKTQQLWQPLRKNFKDYPHFCRAVHEKADALRILQYLKQEQKRQQLSDEDALRDNLRYLNINSIVPEGCMSDFPTEWLSSLREALFLKEKAARHEKAFSGILSDK